MPLNHDRFVTMVPTRYGPRLAPTPEVISVAMRHDPALGESLMRSRIQTRDAMFGATKPPSQGGSTPGIKQKRTIGDEDDPLASTAPGDVVAKLPPLPEGTHYEIELREEGYVVLVEQGEPLGPYDLPEDRVGDRLFAPAGGDPRLKKFNRDARRMWRGQTHDAGVEHVVYNWKIVAPDELLELRGPDSDGFYELVLIQPSKNTVGATPYGGSGDGPEQRSKGATAPSRTGDQRAKLRQMNQANRKFWSGAWR